MTSRSRRFLFGLTALGVAASVALPALAADPVTPTARPQQRPAQQLIEALAQRFHLNQADLQQFFDQQHEQRQTDHINIFLSQAVARGRITEAQKTILLAKAKEVATKMAEYKKLTPEQGREK